MADTTRYVVSTTILEIEERFRAEWTGGIGKDAKFERVSLDYFAHLEGSYEALFLGTDKPDLAVGDRIRITIEKEPNALPSPTSK